MVSIKLKGDGRQVNYLALVYDGELGQMSFYLDGEFQKTASTTVDLKSITPVNRWLGKSVYTWAPNYEGKSMNSASTMALFRLKKLRLALSSALTNFPDHE